jgi:preprotein translocase subunit SecG
MTFLFFTTLVLFLLLCVLLCFVILIQESKSLGLGASFGGDPGDSVFGTSTAAVLKKFTAYLAVIFVVACVLLSLWTSSMGRHKAQQIPASIEHVQG